MKNLLLLFLLFILMLPAVGQTDSVAVKKKNAFNNQFEFDVELVALSCGYNHRLYKKWFLGYNLGLGFGIGIRELPELAHFSITTQYISSKFSFEIAPTTTVYYSFDTENPKNGIAGGISLGVFYGKKIQIGTRGFIGITLSSEGYVEFLGERGNVFITPNLIILKLPIRW